MYILILVFHLYIWVCLKSAVKKIKSAKNLPDLLNVVPATFLKL